MKSTRLQCFLKVADLGSFSAAAEALNLQPSSVTRHVTALEEEMGARFFHRSRKRVALTEAGGLFAPFARRILEEEREARSAISGLQTMPSGMLTISCTRAFGEYWLAAKLPDFLENYPHITVSIRFDDRIVDLGEEGVDLAIRIGALEDSDLIALRILDNDFRLVASPEYLDRHSWPLTLEMLPQHHWVGLATRRWSNLRVLGRDAILPAKSQRVEVNTPSAVHKLVRNGAGLTVLPTWMVADDIASGRLIVLFEDHKFSPYLSDDSAVYAVYQERRFMPPKLRAFLDFLRTEAASAV